MSENLDKFLEDHKARLLQDKAKLENDPPYMEMQNKSAEKLSKASELLISMAKENIPPNSQHIALHDYGLSLPLGRITNIKTQTKGGTRQDYRQYLSQDRLRLERNKEYNQYLREKEEWNERLRRVGKKQIEVKDFSNHTGNNGMIPMINKKDACTSTDNCDGLSNIRLLLDQQHKQDIEPGFGDSLLNKALDEKLNISSQKQGKLDGKPDNYSQRHHKYEDHDPEINDEMDPRFRYESDYDKNHCGSFMGLSLIARMRSQLNEIYLLLCLFPFLGSQDRESIQKRKEQYRQELIEQMAEQQRNKRR
uniref:Uncharacterized protein n=1 Tax=Naja naja TaxID=35670 RepID=A0A8C7DYF6_NAJNA